MADVAHPSITFTVDLSLFATEQIGPNTNAVNPNILHPSRYQNDQDNALVEKNNFRSTRSTWLSGVLGADNRQLEHGDSFTLTGQKAIYLRDTYGIGFAPADRAFLTVTVN